MAFFYLQFPLAFRMFRIESTSKSSIGALPSEPQMGIRRKQGYGFNGARIKASCSPGAAMQGHLTLL